MWQQDKNPPTVAPCSSLSSDDNSSKFWFNTTSKQISIGPVVPGVGGAGRTCFDINHGAGPDLGTYHCHPLYPGGGGERDYPNQQWEIKAVPGVAGEWKQLAAAGPLGQGQCLTLRNSFPPSPSAPTGVTFSERLIAMMRLLKSAGMNGMVRFRSLFGFVLLAFSADVLPTFCSRVCSRLCSFF